MFTVREFRESDTPEVIKVVTTTLKRLFKCRKVDLGQALIDDLEHIKQNYADTGGVFYVGEYGGKVIGTSAAVPDDKNTVCLKRMYLYRKYQGMGFGSKLYGAAEEWCRQNGYQRIKLSTYHHFSDAIKLYEHKGYREYARDSEQIYFVKDIQG
jgi:GNAT superfamily N-acetyltransferase